MAQRTWIGTAASQAQIWKGTITTTTNGHTYELTVTAENGATYLFSYTVANPPDTTATLVATALIAAWNASIHPFLTPITATQSGAQVILTADTAGIPFTVAAGGTGTWSGTGITQANSGPNAYGSAGNWAEGAVPVANDNVRIKGSVAILYDLDQSAVELDDFIVDPGRTGQIGSESAFLKIDCGNSDRFEFNNTGATCWIDVGGAAITAIVKRTKTPATDGQAGLYLRGSAIAAVDLQGGVVTLDTATVTTCYVGSARGTTLRALDNCTLTTVNVQAGGTAHLDCAATTVNNAGGNVYTEGTGAITTVNNDSGQAYLSSSGTVGTCNADGGTVDYTRSRIARTVSTQNFRGGVVKYDPNVITMSAVSYTAPIEVKPQAA